ncbi:uncharacterized protein LOC113295708 [Papaver somniferum]|uniref:uncharacterized protein LOC113295708 n=1 Tax=Papaver somniferum TaxID=3469 RepID=UPI000E704418|nr:uncharacterized protein LOC113295708 [Papaver somniferum]
MEHIIFYCKHARAVWKGIDINIDMISGNFTTVSGWVISWFTSANSGIEERLLYMITIWILWKDRCNVFFQGVTLNSVNYVHKILYHLASHMHTASLNPTILCIKSSSSNWKTPPVGMVKLNVDGSFDYETNKYGIDIVIRDHLGTCLGTKGSNGDGSLNPEAVECMAVRDALFWALRKNYSSIQIEVDARLVIESINGTSSLVQ